MTDIMDSTTLKGKQFYFVGIKGAGMSALALLLHQKGAFVSGTDTEDIFPTQEPLERLGIPFTTSLHSDLLPLGADCVIHSAAYDDKTSPAIAGAKLAGVPCLTYPQALGLISQTQLSVAICGTHGKTTTTAMAGVMLKALGAEGSTLVGSAVRDFDGLPINVAGGTFFVAETCEYRRHFLSFSPTVMVALNIEWEHVDYFKSEADTDQAFCEMAHRLPIGGTLIYCADDRGSVRLSESLKVDRPDVVQIPYGFSDRAKNGLQVTSLMQGEGRQIFRLEGIPFDFDLPLMGRELVLNAVAALAVVKSLDFRSQVEIQRAAQKLAEFQGVRRRQERLGISNGAIILDDYAHHPTEIVVILHGIRAFYPTRRLVVDFMFHTVSRTKGFLNEFAQVLSLADVVLLHSIYTSAREGRAEADQLMVNLEEIMRQNYPDLPLKIFNTQEDAILFLRDSLGDQDVFITLGAGDNFHISHTLAGIK